MSGCPKTAPEIINQLCGLHYYPEKCTNACNRHFQRWLKEEPEVQKIHKKWLQSQTKEGESE